MEVKEYTLPCVIVITSQKCDLMCKSTYLIKCICVSASANVHKLSSSMEVDESSIAALQKDEQDKLRVRDT